MTCPFGALCRRYPKGLGSDEIAALYGMHGTTAHRSRRNSRFFLDSLDSSLPRANIPRFPGNRRRIPENRRRIAESRRRIPANRRRPTAMRRGIPNSRRRFSECGVTAAVNRGIIPRSRAAFAQMRRRHAGRQRSVARLAAESRRYAVVSLADLDGDGSSHGVNSAPWAAHVCASSSAWPSDEVRPGWIQFWGRIVNLGR
jgi:hypothetical protein